jgi:hypothetical protein
MIKLRLLTGVRPRLSRSLLTNPRQTIDCLSHHHRREGSVERRAVFPVRALLSLRLSLPQSGPSKLPQC